MKKETRITVVVVKVTKVNLSLLLKLKVWEWHTLATDSEWVPLISCCARNALADVSKVNLSAYNININYHCYHYKNSERENYKNDEFIIVL